MDIPPCPAVGRVKTAAGIGAFVKNYTKNFSLDASPVSTHPAQSSATIRITAMAEMDSFIFGKLNFTINTPICINI